MAGMTTTYAEQFFCNNADYTAVASTASEASLLAGGGDQQPMIPAGFLTALGAQNIGKSLRFEAAGVFSTTGTPTLIFQTRLGTTVGDADLSGVSVGLSTTITTGSGVSNKPWYLVLDLDVRTPGQGSTACILNCHGTVWSGGGGSSASGFASPFIYTLEPSAPDTATWTASVTASSALFFNLSATWSASSASNTITCKRLRGFVLN